MPTLSAMKMERIITPTHTMGISPQVRYAINSSLAFTLGTNFGWKSFHQNDERDTKIYSVSPSVDIKTGAKGSLRSWWNHWQRKLWYRYLF